MNVTPSGDLVPAGYLDLFFDTRIREQGQPHTKGLLRRRRIVDGEAFIQALGDTVRVAIALGSSDSVSALQVVRHDYGISVASQPEWLDQAEQHALLRVDGLADDDPVWRAFISIVAAAAGGEPQVFNWIETGRGIDVRDDEYRRMVDQAVSSYTSAFGWAIRNPERASDWLAPGSPDSETFASAYDAFVGIAEELLRRYRSAVMNAS